MKKSPGFLTVAAAALSFSFMSPKADKFVVVIDAGHGGKDHGATHEMATEKSITENVARKIKELNLDKEVEIHLTRDSDEFMELKSRTDLINSVDADLVLSIHVQANKNVAAKGVEMYVGKDNPQKEKSLAFAQKLGVKLQKNHGFNLRPTQEAPFFVLKNSKVPAVLVELGFITNADDYRYLTSEAEQHKIAASIAEFVTEAK
ncbi:N-acetylmuramoyl-L-alanine amidase [Flavobacterium sp.]|uniref:N-acetylmuramoyl-L-alanine amidase family protein n=1 Tax=Flavobacterium sp. TaxID=239 RepID=UPI0012151AAB|nr:N-acetylmuramoyl-L-alanine amidase [Flavobacterium sp.]RZJ71806.1 MAG: N-acetylmuramoyl-L-alanine amidase [Flavobacterium sp.]